MFDAIVGNPPYQEDHNNSTQYSDNNVSNVFHSFQETADVLSDMNSMIYPGERWLLKIGRHMEKFGNEQLNSSSLHKVILYPDSRDVFQNAWVSGGVSIILKNSKTRNNNEWEFIRDNVNSAISAKIKQPIERKISVYPLLNLVIEKMDSLPWEKRLSDNVKTQKFFRISSDEVEKNPGNFVECNKDFSNQPKSMNIRVFTNDKSGKSGKATWFWMNEKHVKNGHSEINKWKVIMSSANLTGENGRTPNVEIIPPRSIVGRVRLVIASFTTQTEAENYVKFLNTNIVRVLLTTTGNYITGFGSNVKTPDNFLNNSDIDFSEKEQTVNEQLVNLLNLSDKEQEAIAMLSNNLSPLMKEQDQRYF